MQIGVYGLGRFGSFWAEALSSCGHEVIGYSPHSAPRGVSFSLAREDEVLSSPLIFFTVAISSIREAIEKTRDRIGRNSIVCDCCSVKSYPASVMKELLLDRAYAIATHPMFGPDSASEGLCGLPVVMSEVSPKDERYCLVKSLFTDMGLRVIEMTADEHDEAAAFSQGVAHFLGRTLSAMGLKDTPIATKGYKALLEIMRQTCNDPYQLFVDLQRYNPYTKSMRDSFRRAADEVSASLDEEDEEKR